MNRLALLLFLSLTLFLSAIKDGQCQGGKFVILYNNIESDPELESDWGYAAWIEMDGQVYLFDSGAKGEILSSNLKKLNLEPGRIKLAIISHLHDDHIGGLSDFYQQLKPGTKVYLPEKAGDGLVRKMKNLDFRVEPDFEKVDENIWITKVFENSSNRIKEHAVVIEKENSIIILTGCAHPGIVEICQGVTAFIPRKKPELVTGGFHLGDASEAEVKRISTILKSLGIEKLGPSHCTGEKAIEIFRKEWGGSFVQLFLGDGYRF